MTVGIVVVSHSARLAEGVVELCAPVAPRVAVVAAGGDDAGGLGTSLAKVQAAARRADSGDGAVLVGDLGSALLTAESAVELEGAADRWRVADGPFVEGAVAAAVAAAGGAGLVAVAAAAGGDEPAPPPDAPAPRAADSEAVVVLRNADGLHARPAAALVRLAARFDAAVQVDRADARSLLQVIALGLGQGAEVRVSAVGPDAEAAVDAVRSLIEGGFGEA